MEIKGMTVAQFEAIVAHVSRQHYGENVVCEWQRRTNGAPTLLNQAGDRFRGRVIVRDSAGMGARRSASGRRMPAACWHVIRDVVREALRVHPGAVFRTSMATYRADTFERVYPSTGNVNIGSRVAPVTMPELCDCSPAHHQLTAA